MEIEAVDFVSVPTRDPARAVAFYRDVLGLPVGAAGEVETPNVTGNTVILHRRYAPRA